MLVQRGVPTAQVCGPNGNIPRARGVFTPLWALWGYVGYGDAQQQPGLAAHTAHGLGCWLPGCHGYVSRDADGAALHHRAAVGDGDPAELREPHSVLHITVCDHPGVAAQLPTPTQQWEQS